MRRLFLSCGSPLTRKTNLHSTSSAGFYLGENEDIPRDIEKALSFLRSPLTRETNSRCTSSAGFIFMVMKGFRKIWIKPYFIFKLPQN